MADIEIRTVTATIGARVAGTDGFAQRLVGLSVPESRRILDLLQAYVTRPEHVLRRRWSENQLVLFRYSIEGDASHCTSVAGPAAAA